MKECLWEFKFKFWIKMNVLDLCKKRKETMVHNLLTKRFNTLV